MPKSFYEFCEQMAHQDDGAPPMVANDIEFWDKLSQIANSVPDDVANFLEVPSESVVKWHGIIQQAIKRSQEKRSVEKKNDMLDTGKSLSQ